jgi:hypothetical protein
MKRHFVVSLFGSFVGVGMLLLLLSAAGIVGARSADVRSDVSRANDVSAATPLTSTFTYQGQLINSGSPVSSACGFQFGLWDSASGLAQIGLTQTVSSVSVSRGLFTALLNTGNEFGDTAFNGDARWLQIAVRCPDSGSYTAMSTRQPLTSLPFALPGLRTFPNATSPNIIGGYSGNFISTTVVGSVIGGGGASGFPNRVQANYTTVGGGQFNTARGDEATVSGGGGNTASATYGTVGGGYQNTASAISGDSSTVAGGYQNTASNDAATVGGGFVNNASGPAATVSGGFSNTASGDHASVGGGWVNMASGSQATVSGGISNTASISQATVSGGISNTASADSATVGGGAFNTASGVVATVGGGVVNTASGDYATVGGGNNNHASVNYATVGGGNNNHASYLYAAVGGGDANRASGWAATVPGGSNNTAAGYYSFAAGQQAHANHDGTFVWADSTGTTFASTASDQFLIRAKGGVGINTNTPATSLQVAKDFANSSSFGQIEAVGATNNNKRMTMGFDTTNNIGWLQASETFVAYRDLALNPNGGFVSIGSLGGAGSTQLCRNASNQIATCSSSLRYKSNVANLNLGLDTVAQLHPVTFDWKGTGEPDLGFVAEEVNQVTPLLTTRNADGQIEGVKYDHISAVLVNAVQEQQQQIADLKSQVASLHSQNDAQQKQMDDLQTRLSKAEQTTAASTPLSQAEPFNVSTLLSVLALIAVGWIGLQQRRSKRGAA